MTDQPALVPYRRTPEQLQRLRELTGVDAPEILMVDPRYLPEPFEDDGVEEPEEELIPERDWKFYDDRVMPKVLMREIRITGNGQEPASFYRAHMVGWDFTNSRLNGASFADAVLRDTWFDSCRLRHARFRRADLRGASFSNADLVGADFRGAQLDGVHQFRGARLHGAKGLPDEWVEQVNAADRERLARQPRFWMSKTDEDGYPVRLTRDYPRHEIGVMPEETDR